MPGCCRYLLLLDFGTLEIPFFSKARKIAVLLLQKQEGVNADVKNEICYTFLTSHPKVLIHYQRRVGKEIIVKLHLALL